MSNTTGSPRDLDPKFKDATIPADAKQNEDVVTESPKTADAKDSGPEVTMIVFKQRYVDSNGVQGEKVHGPMPVSEWAAYEKENGL